MRRWITTLLIISAAWAAPGRVACAQQVGATSSGDWNNASIWTSGTVPGSSDDVYIGSTDGPSGSAATATVTLTQAQSAADVYLGYGAGSSGALNLGNNALTISNVLVLGQYGGTGTIQEGSGGSFAAYQLVITGGTSLTFGANDSVTGYFTLTNGSTATTAATGNVTGNTLVTSGSTLNLGADLDLGSGSGYIQVYDQGSVLNMNGHAITANQVALGYEGTAPVTVQNQGVLTTTSLYVGNGMTYNLLAADKVGDFYLSNATSTLNGTVSYLSLANGATAMTMAGTPMAMNDVLADGGSALTLHGGDVINNLISLTNNSLLTVQETNGTGLTFNGTSVDSLLIDPSHMDLNFTSTGWDFRWQDPSGGGNWIGTIDGLIGAGDIVLNLPAGFTYQVVDQGGYTYIEGISGASVPEPSSLVLAVIAGAGVAVGRKWRRSRPRR